MEKIINLLINNWTKGVDTYTHNGSTWLIFSESKQWVIELTESKTLWYNYNFFKELFSLTSMDVVDNQHYITKWVEDNLINKVKDTILERNITEGEVDDIIQDGVKNIRGIENDRSFFIEDTIDNGVKHTEYSLAIDGSCVIDDIIDNGVKETQFNDNENKSWVEGVIKNGVKETKTLGKDGDIMSTIEWMDENNSSSYTKMIDDVIDNGVKETLNTEYMPQVMVEDTIQNGIKKTILRQNITDGNVETIIETGIKETQPLPDQSGELIGYGNYYHDKEDRTKAFYNYLEETIKFGVKENLV